MLEFYNCNNCPPRIDIPGIHLYILNVDGCLLNTRQFIFYEKAALYFADSVPASARRRGGKDGFDCLGADLPDGRDNILKNGTGLFAGTVASFPAGTKMHVVMEDGDWLYVDVPRGEMEYLMDPEGTFGYVKKEDVLMASMICMLDWTE